MAEINKDPQDVSEAVDGILATGDKPVTLDDFLQKLDEAKKRNVHKFDRLDVYLASKSGAAVFMVAGVRKETQAEVDARVAREEDKRKNIDEHEFKEYLRLRKKFDKKREE